MRITLAFDIAKDAVYEVSFDLPQVPRVGDEVEITDVKVGSTVANVDVKIDAVHWRTEPPSVWLGGSAIGVHNMDADWEGEAMVKLAQGEK